MFSKKYLLFTIFSIMFVLLVVFSRDTHAQAVSVNDCEITFLQQTGMNVNCPAFSQLGITRTYYLFSESQRNILLGLALTAYSLDDLVRIRIMADGQTIDIIRVIKR